MASTVKKTRTKASEIGKKKYECNFSKVLFTEESGTTIHGTDSWRKVLVVNRHHRHQRLSRQ